MISRLQLIKDFTSLGLCLKAASENRDTKDPLVDILEKAIEQAYLHNPWFITDNTRFALTAWAEALTEDKVSEWIHLYFSEEQFHHQRLDVGIIMAGNIPMVGLHDLLCVMASGNRALIKLSSSDEFLIPAILTVLCSINEAYRDYYKFIEGTLKTFDVIIATGSNNSSRYFDYYFGKYPHIIRKNRNGIAVLTGDETEEELYGLADDIFMFFGLGCRNVSKLYLPKGYDIDKFFRRMEKYAFLADNHKYRNNYDYQKSLLLINRVPHHDNGFLLVKPDLSLISPISVVHTEEYSSPSELRTNLESIADQIQCIISKSVEIEGAIMPGRSQFPELWDYADGVDTMKFLVGLTK